MYFSSMTPRLGFIGMATMLFGFSSCASQSGSEDTGSSGGSTSIIVGNGGTGGGGIVGTGSTTAAWPPAGYVNVTNTTIGAYALGPEIVNGSVTAPGVCAGLFGVRPRFQTRQPDWRTS